MKYIIICKKCGRILMKTEESIVFLLKLEIQCPQCEKILFFPQDIKVYVEKPHSLSQIKEY